MNWALFGASTIASQYMIAAIRSQQAGAVGWVVSGNADRAATYAQTHDIAQWSTSVDQALADDSVQAVYISSTNQNHHAQAIVAIAAGKHVLCEKPLAMDAAQARAMVAAAKTAGITLSINHHLRCAANRPGVLTKVGIHTFVDPLREGCAMNDKAAAAPIVKRVEFDGDTWLHFPNIAPNVAILRASTADEHGNLTYEHEGAYLGGLEQAICVRNHGGLVIAQVSRVTKRGSLRPHDVRVPGHLVDLIVIDPDQKQTCETLYDPAISGQVMRPWNSFSLAEDGVEKIIARRAAMELRPGMTANLGFGISAMVPRILLEEGHPEAVTWAVEQGAVGGVPLTGFAFGCASNADAFVPSPQQFIYFQGGGFDVSFLSFLEVDVEGNVNLSKLGKKPYLTAGCGGFVDITSGARKIVFSGWFEAGAQIDLTPEGINVTAPGKFTKMVAAVEHVTFSGKRARELGQEVLYITERCVMRLGETGLVATEIMPGIDAERDIVQASDGRVAIAPDAMTLPVSLLADAPMGWGQ